ncbi:hypothetical protein EV122DRAFT_260670 [Schizophyllum commune]
MTRHSHEANLNPAMSTIAIRVELPAYSHSFQVHVPPSASVQDLKREIARSCPGTPRVEGQRLICRGRALDDNERVEDVWKSPDHMRVVHLAVHPSAWTGAPPRTTQASAANPIPAPTNVFAHASIPHARRTIPTWPSGDAEADSRAYSKAALEYVYIKHREALSALTGQPVMPLPPNLLDLRPMAKSCLESRHGLKWPSILDEPLPDVDGEGEGVVYDRTVIDGVPYYRLRDPQAKPTSRQIHAAKVLAVTFPLLNLPPALPPTPVAVPSLPTGLPPDIHQLMRQLNLPPMAPLRVDGDNVPGANGINVVHVNRPAIPPELQNLQIRPLIVPLLVLVFRVMLLLYFLDPEDSPIYAVFILGFVIWEMWGLVMRGIPREPGQQRENGGNAAPAAAGAPANGGEGNGAAPNNIALAANIQSQATEYLGAQGLAAEDAALNAPNAPPPTVGQKVIAFTSLLLSTIHPAVWERRRALLRRREGQIRTEERARQAAQERAANGEGDDSTDQPAPPPPRPRAPWVQEYVQRVLADEWVDESAD